MNHDDLPGWLEPNCRALDREIESGRFGHAPLLPGPFGSGKRRLAHWLAARLLCLDVRDGNPCGRCRACELLAAGTHPDFFHLALLEDKREILVDQVREFVGSLSLTPSVGRRRVGLIEPADLLNRNAANALLKTLEEPPDEVWLILVVDREDWLPATVRSRCQRMVIALPGPEDALEWLRGRHDGVDVERCRLALNLADGVPGLADHWLADGGLERGLEIGRTLADLLEGKELDLECLEQWRQNPEETWRWLARFCRFWFDGLSGPLPEFLSATRRPAGAEAARRLQRCWASALEGNRLAAAPVRHDWLFRTWLSEWRQLARCG